MSTATSTDPVWSAGADAKDDFPPLRKNTEADVCIVGAGIAGITIAYELCQAGKTVVVLDSNTLGGGETAHTTAHLVNALDNRYTSIAWAHGDEGARLAAQSHTAAIATIETNASAEKIDCDFARVDGYLFAPKGQSPKELEKELEAAHAAGLMGVALLERVPHLDERAGKCLYFPRLGQFHPMKYLRGLAAAVQRMGGVIHGGSHALDMAGGKDAHVTTKSKHTVRCGAVVVASNTPVNDRITMHTKQAGYQTYVVGFRVQKKDVVPALFWDTLDPFHYVRFARTGSGHDVLIVGGEDHKTGQADHTDERFGRLESWGREMFPFAQEVEYRWSGEVMESQDGLGFIGRNPGDEPNVYVVTGDSGNGMTHGTIAGRLITDLILGRENPWARVYDPARKSLRCLGTFLKENLNVAAQYSDWVTPGEISGPDDLKPSQGAVMRKGLHKIALFRDGKGKLHQFSATCPHLKGVVAYNAAEQSFDCPCHGSRFSAATGEVIHGPSLTGLEPIKEG
jgi:glycine/D-amino acid oxidase-like deaminating enzyme/nitrite reductase/ring-hydroxylating ferredoxin subunit